MYSTAHHVFGSLLHSSIRSTWSFYNTPPEQFYTFLSSYPRHKRFQMCWVNIFNMFHHKTHEARFSGLRVFHWGGGHTSAALPGTGVSSCCYLRKPSRVSEEVSICNSGLGLTFRIQAVQCASLKGILSEKKLEDVHKALFLLITQTLCYFEQ